MKFKELLSVLPEFHQPRFTNPPMGTTELLNQECIEICTDTRQVKIGCAFVAVQGQKFDSHSQLAQVVEHGAVVLIVEKDIVRPSLSAFKGLVLEVENSRVALALLAAKWFNNPSNEMLCFGVTGTNGKTSCTYMMEHLMNSVRIDCGVIGTVNHHLRDKVWPTEATTPGPLELHARLREMREAGARGLAMEVSSHALDQYRVSGVHFNVVMFTNLTRDHLDYHESMEQYFAAKQKLFSDLLWQSNKVPTFAVINVDDPWGRKLRIPAYAGLWTYGTSAHSDWRFKLLDMGYAITRFELQTPFGPYTASLPLCGVHNVYNAVGVIAAAAALGVPPEFSIQQMNLFKGVPGRLQVVSNSRQLNVLVDYAHSPDALENVLNSLVAVRQQSQATHSRIITVFGCGGDRDKGKRPQMAAIAEKKSDVVIVTSDNPRTEDPMAIINDILAGFDKMKPEVVVDRRLAIGRALQICEPQDVVLIAGKGHEDYQIIGTEKTHFSDVEVASEILEGVSRQI